MSELTFKYDESGKSAISAFAYNTGHLIEELIKDKTDNLEEENKLLEAKILDFYQQLDGEIKVKYEKYFDIKSIPRKHG